MSGFPASLAQNDSSSTPDLLEFSSDSRAIELLESSLGNLADRDEFSFEIDIEFDNVLVTGEKIQYSAYQEIVVSRPNRLFVDYVGDLNANQLFHDGENLSIFYSDTGFYISEEASVTIDELVLDLEEIRGVSIPLSTLLLSDPLDRISNAINSSTYLGTSYVNRVPAQHLLFTTDEKDFQIWVSEGDTPLIQKIVITYKTLSGQPQYTAVFSNWNFDPNTEDDAFTFVPSDGDRQVDFLPQE
ncbi:MAG: DUF2092 domain-containing protein [Synechococcus sp.]